MWILDRVLCRFIGHDESVYDPVKDNYKCRSCNTVLEEAPRRNRFSYPLPLPPTRHVTREAPKPSCEPLEGPVQRIKREGPPRE